MTVPPLKETDLRSEIRFSKWLENVRKDVECVFRTLKSRWRVLKTGIRMHGILNCDMNWLTCCALHHMLLEVDRLSVKWTEGVPTDYETMDDCEMDIPDAIRKLFNPYSNMISDLSRMGHGNDVEMSKEYVDFDFDADVGVDIETEVIQSNSDGCIHVKDLSLHSFRKKLITHFNMSFKCNEVKWLQRNKT